MVREERIKFILQELQRDPSDVFLNYALGLEYAADTSRHEMAEKQFLKVLSLEPGHTAANYQVGKLLESKGDVNNALKHFRAGLEAARARKDLKTASEFEEAIFLLEE
jgi:tetratricopeptide (TPR) repeat protein